MNTRLLSFVLILSLTLSACGTAVATTSETQAPSLPCPKPESNFVCYWHNQSGQWLFISAPALDWPKARLILPSAATAEQIMQGGIMTTSYSVVAVLIPVTLVLNPNLIQHMVEGPPRIRVGDTLYVSQPDGSVREIQLVGDTLKVEITQGRLAGEDGARPAWHREDADSCSFGIYNPIKQWQIGMVNFPNSCPEHEDSPMIGWFIKKIWESLGGFNSEHSDSLIKLAKLYGTTIP